MLTEETLAAVAAACNPGRQLYASKLMLSPLGPLVPNCLDSGGSGGLESVSEAILLVQTMCNISLIYLAMYTNWEHFLTVQGSEDCLRANLRGV